MIDRDAGRRTALVAAIRAIALALVLCVPICANAAEAEGPGESDAAAGEDQSGEESFLFGLDFSLLAGSGNKAYGPGLTWGLILSPDLLEMGLSFGAMIGDGKYTVPIELRFWVPFELLSWLDFYPVAGPSLLLDREDDTWTHDFAALIGAGLELRPEGLQFGTRIQGDYQVRFWKDIVQQGGFTIALLYRF